MYCCKILTNWMFSILTIIRSITSVLSRLVAQSYEVIIVIVSWNVDLRITYT